MLRRDVCCHRIEDAAVTSSGTFRNRRRQQGRGLAEYGFIYVMCLMDRVGSFVNSSYKD